MTQRWLAVPVRMLLDGKYNPAGATITDTTPGTNDLSIGALGLRSHASLTAAPLGTLNDAVAAGGSCSFMTRG